jgi:hypothetical protein
VEQSDIPSGVRYDYFENVIRESDKMERLILSLVPSKIGGPASRKVNN